MSDVSPESSIAASKRDEWGACLSKQLDEEDQRFRKNKDRWNFWYYGSLYGSIGFSALAALVLKLETPCLVGEWQKDAAALFATLAAILGTAATTGKFERRWRTARQARASMQKLRIDLYGPDADLKKVGDDLKKVIDTYHEGVVDDDD